MDLFLTFILHVLLNLKKPTKVQYNFVFTLLVIYLNHLILLRH